MNLSILRCSFRENNINQTVGITGFVYYQRTGAYNFVYFTIIIVKCNTCKRKGTKACYREGNGIILCVVLRIN